MNKLRIVTKDWKIVDFDAILFIGMMEAGEDKEGRPLYSLIGRFNLDLDYTTLYTSISAQKVLQSFNYICMAIDSQKPLVDLRESDEEETDLTTIKILPNLKNKNVDLN